MYEHFSIPGESCRIPFADLCRRNSEFRTYFIRKTYDASQCIHPQGTKITSFGIVETGILKAVDHTRKDAEMCHAYFEARDIFPEFLYFSGEKEYSYTLAAEKRSTVLWVPVQVMEEMLEKDRQLLYCLNYQTIRERIAYWIVGMHDIAPAETIRMPGSQLMLANMLHVSRSSLNQELKLMEKEGYFRITGHEMQGWDKEKLEELV